MSLGVLSLALAPDQSRFKKVKLNADWSTLIILRLGKRALIGAAPLHEPISIQATLHTELLLSCNEVLHNGPQNPKTSSISF